MPHVLDFMAPCMQAGSKATCSTPALFSEINESCSNKLINAS